MCKDVYFLQMDKKYYLFICLLIYFILRKNDKDKNNYEIRSPHDLGAGKL